ncbi:unnamed protein product [Thelazia callipaeda]|uniref:Uncharacterized protein n=1 Tax=Thelazia callipaeda TaxID=103827 RepID=A0A0N5CLQ9_THECL|nr:unnamed protein product [Thelazia callipaeda]
MMASNHDEADSTHAASKDDIRVSAQLLLPEIENLEKLQESVGMMVLDVVEKRLTYPSMIASYVAQENQCSLDRLENAEISWESKITLDKDIDNMFEMIEEIRAKKTENSALFLEIEEVKKQINELRKTANTNNDFIHSVL